MGRMQPTESLDVDKIIHSCSPVWRQKVVGVAEEKQEILLVDKILWGISQARIPNWYFALSTMGMEGYFRAGEERYKYKDED
jgi:hypothetical protein